MATGHWTLVIGNWETRSGKLAAIRDRLLEAQGMPLYLNLVKLGIAAATARYGADRLRGDIQRERSHEPSPASRDEAPQAVLERKPRLWVGLVSGRGWGAEDALYCGGEIESRRDAGSKPGEKLDVTFGAKEGGADEAGRGEAVGLGPAKEVFKDEAVDGGVLDNAAFADEGPAGFELRLN
jgi:hypothetical protein